MIRRRRFYLKARVFLNEEKPVMFFDKNLPLMWNGSPDHLPVAAQQRIQTSVQAFRIQQGRGQRRETAPGLTVSTE
jgi:hypothetical protein